MADPHHPRRAENDPAGSGASLRTQVGPTAGSVVRMRNPLPTRVEALPPLPLAYHAALETGLVHLGLALDAGQRSAVDAHVRLLLAWNAAINLTAITDPRTIATRHVLDSLTAVPLLRARGVDRLVDLGSGSGFPGIPLAVTVPCSRVLLVESIGKKAQFLRAAVSATGLQGRVEVAAERAEGVAAQPAERASWPAVAARAVAPLADLIELAFPLLEPGGCLVAWKRGEISDELAAGQHALAELGGGTLEVVPVALPDLPDHCLVVATRRGAVPDRYPRDVRQRHRQPW